MIGAVIAMQSEADILLQGMNVERSFIQCGKQIYVGSAYGKPTVLCICGVGKVNAAIGAQILISSFNVDCLLNFGVAGGLNDGVSLCQVYAIDQAVQFDFDLVQLNGTKMGTLNEYEEPYLPLNVTDLPFPCKRLGTADRFNDSRDDFMLLTQELQADIRDMEGGAIVQTAKAANMPIYAFKAISDLAGSGSTTEQFLVNKDKALVNLKAALPAIFEQL